MTSGAISQKSETGILVCFALKEESAPFRKIAASKPGISILLTGIGKANAEKSIRKVMKDGALSLTRYFQDISPGKSPTAFPRTLVITAGFAGGLNSELKLGEVVFETTSEPLAAKLCSAGAKPAKFFCADHIATTSVEKRNLFQETGADVVEMESGVIQAICGEHGVPCATVRVISDTADEDLPLNFNALSKPDKSLDFAKLFLAIARAPGKIGPLMQLQKNTTFAAGQLAAILAKLTFP